MAEDKTKNTGSPIKQSGDPFESAKGEVFGGSVPILILGVNECSPRLRFERLMKLPLKEDDGTTKLMQVPVAKNTEDPEGKVYSLPIGAVFRKAWDEANMEPGDELLIKRMDDATKKSGKGAGRAFHVYALKVVSRAPRANSGSAQVSS